jgi:hypothetical protein
MRAAFVRPDQPDAVVATATWTKDGPTIQTQDEDARVALARVFQRGPVVIDDPSLRPFGASGPVTLQFGTVRWFRAAAEARGGREGLAVRFVADGPPLAWDPAGAYRPLAAAEDARR